MARRMSCSMTVDAVRERRKTVTRRHADTWKSLEPGDRLTLIEKGMGLPKGARQVVLAEVEVVDVRVEPIGRVDHAECHREGFPWFLPADFLRLWLGSHGYGHLIASWPAGTPTPPDVADVPCRRIEWRYLDDEADRG